MLLVISSLLSLLGYLLTNKRAYRYVWHSQLDDKVPLVPIFILPYLSLFPYIALSYLLLQSPHLTSFATTILVCNILANIFWYFWPNGVPRLAVKNDSWSHRVINRLYKTDNDTNGFPSGHVFLSVICSYYLSLQYAALTPLFMVLGGSIVISTVLVKQHYLVDILGGLIFAGLSLWMSQYLMSGIL